MYDARRLASSYKKSSVKAIASIFDEFTGVMNSFVLQKDIWKVSESPAGVQ